jgi:hypothetical protein
MDNTGRSAQWRQYPFQLVPGDSQLVFPAAEGAHPDYESDTWYLAGTLTGEKSGRRFAFITIFNRNRPGGELVADFYTFALFDIDHGSYGTFTDYDMPPKNMEPGARPKLVCTCATRAAQERPPGRRAGTRQASSSPTPTTTQP